MMSRTTLTKVGSEGDGRRPPETIFTAKALTKIYTSGEVEVPALRGLDLDIWAGEVVVLLGPFGQRQVDPSEHHGRP